MNLSRPSLAAVLLVVAASIWAPSAIGSPDDSHRALLARQSGHIVALDTLLRDIERQIDGRLLHVELDDDEPRRLYEIRWQMKDGRRLEIEVDAQTGEWISIEGPRLETVWKARR
jgi:hypothetical protein